MKMKLETTGNSCCPAGIFSGKLIAAKEPRQKRKACPVQVQLTFCVYEPDGTEHLVYNKYCGPLRAGTELYTVLEGWLGDVTRFADADGEIELDQFLNWSADIQVVHIDDGNHAGPFVTIGAVLPPGAVPLAA